MLALFEDSGCDCMRTFGHGRSIPVLTSVGIASTALILVQRTPLRECRAPHQHALLVPCAKQGSKTVYTPFKRGVK